MNNLLELLVTLIFIIIIVGFVLYLLRRALATFIEDPKLREMIWIVVLLLTFLGVVSYFLTGGAPIRLPRLN
jgi:Kef-type K+ transport system membrane component KefB